MAIIERRRARSGMRVETLDTRKWWAGTREAACLGNQSAKSLKEVLKIDLADVDDDVVHRRVNLLPAAHDHRFLQYSTRTMSFFGVFLQ